MSESFDDSVGPIDLESISILVPKAKIGDQIARDEICRQVQTYLQMIANQHLDPGLRRKLNPSDVVQLAMTRMINGFENFRGKTSNEFYAWLTAIIKNEINTTRRDLHRDKRDIKRETELTNQSGNMLQPAIADPQLTPSSEAIKAERLRQLEKIMEKLPSEMATVIRLRTLEELPFKEVADQMGKSYDAVNKLWRRAIVKFQNELNDQNESMS